MRVALLTNYAASKKEPLSEMMGRVHQAFLDAGLHPEIRFNFGDAPVAGFVSSVDRVIKRHPELARFVTSESPMPGIAGARRISNGPMSAAAGERVDFALLQKIAAGVPRSFPFHSVVFHFHSTEFGELGPTDVKSAQTMSGILLTDSWWVNGRKRSMSACLLVDADPGSKKLPAPEGPLAAVLAACGKARKTIQAPLPGTPITVPTPAVRTPAGFLTPSVDPEAAIAVKAIAVDYRTRLQEVVARAAMPHELPPVAQALQAAALGIATGPKKPVLERAFKPMGYTCRGESGTLTLRRRTAANLTVELHLDVGTWSRSVTAMFRVLGAGFKAVLSLPVSPSHAVPAQYPIGDADRWQKIVENLAALVAELDRTMVPEIEAAAGPSPDWYRPES